MSLVAFKGGARRRDSGCVVAAVYEPPKDVKQMLLCDLCSYRGLSQSREAGATLQQGEGTPG